MSERGREEKKKIFPAGTARALGGARLPVENIFFRILRFSEARIFPLAGKSALFPAEYLAQNCSAGKSGLFPAVSVANGVFAGRVLVLRAVGRAGFGSAGWGMSIRASVHAGKGGQNITKGGVFLH